MTQPDTIRQLLALGEDSSSAIEAPGRPALDYRGLRAQVDSTATSLNAAGIDIPFNQIVVHRPEA